MTGGGRDGGAAAVATDAGADPAASGPPVGKPESKRTDLAGLAFWTTLAQVSLPITSLISGPILARALGPDGRGVYAAVLAPLQVLAFVAAVGLPDATTYAVARLRIPKPHIVAALGKVTLLYSVIAAALLIIFAPVLLHRTPQAVTLLQLTALTLPATMFLTILRQATSGSNDFKWRNIERTLSGVLRLVGLVLFAVLGWLTIDSSVWVTMITSVVGVPVLLVALLGWRVVPNLKTDPEVKKSHPHLTRQLMKYGFRGWGGTFAYLINWRLDQAVMVVLVDARQLGFYAVAVSLAELPQTAFIQLRNILFAESARRDDMLLVARGCRVLIAFTVVMAVAGAAIAPVLVPLMFGHEFEPAVLMAQILLIGTIPFLVGQVLNGGLLSLGHPFRASAGQLVGATLTITGLLVFCPRVGAIGAAWTSLAAYTVNALVCGTIFCRETGLRPRQLLVMTRNDVQWLNLRVQKVRAKAGRRPGGGGPAGGAPAGGGAQVAVTERHPITSEHLLPETAIEAAELNPYVMDEPVEAYEPPPPAPVERPANPPIDADATRPMRVLQPNPASAPTSAEPHTQPNAVVLPHPAPHENNLALVFLGEEANLCQVCHRRTVRHVFEAGRKRWIFFGPPSGRNVHTRSVCLGCGDVRMR